MHECVVYPSVRIYPMPVVGCRAARIIRESYYDTNEDYFQAREKMMLQCNSFQK